jgi:hypothetical protein
VFNDYGKFGLWTDGYYASFNMFEKPQGLFQGSNVCALDRQKMLRGESALMICFLLKGIGAPLPASIDGAAPAPLPEYFLGLGASELNAWRLTVAWSKPQASTLAGPAPVSGTETFARACDDKTCDKVPQKGSAALLDSMGDRLMYRLSYRHYSDHESLVVNHAVRILGTSAPGTIGTRWYELRSSDHGLSVYRQGTYAPDATSRWMGSAAMDKRGDLLLGYSASSSDAYGSVRITGTEDGSPRPQTQLDKEVILIEGGVSQDVPNWGDYTTLAVDPSDDCTFWYFSEYLHSGELGWRTRVVSVVFPSCLK